MQIIEFQAENVKKLKVVVIKPKPGPGVVQLTGANGSGKTSVLDSILYTLAGTEDLPSQPIRRGADKGAVQIDLGEFKVMRKFSHTGAPLLIVEGKHGERFQKPQQLLDSLLGDLAFDPLAFTRLKPKAQADELRRLVKLEIDPDEIDTANRDDYETRTMINREIKGLQAQVDAISIVAELPEKSIDISALLAKMEAAGTKNSEIVEIEGDLKRRRDFNAEQLAAAGRLRAQADELVRQAMQKETAAAEDQKKIAAIVIPERIDTSALREEIENARATNTQIEKRTQKELMQTRLEAKIDLAASLTARMKEREEVKSKAIGKAEMPVEGLGFENGEVMYNGLPMNQASGAEQLRISLAIAMASNPKLRVIRIVDGSLLDPDSLEIVKQMAIARDYQIWIESVDTSGKVGIVMEDGEVKTVNDDEAAETQVEPDQPVSKNGGPQRLSEKVMKQTKEKATKGAKVK